MGDDTPKADKGFLWFAAFLAISAWVTTSGKGLRAEALLLGVACFVPSIGLCAIGYRLSATHPRRGWFLNSLGYLLFILGNIVLVVVLVEFVAPSILGTRHAATNVRDVAVIAAAFSTIILAFLGLSYLLLFQRSGR
jgi:hypothetical protein